MNVRGGNQARKIRRKGGKRNPPKQRKTALKSAKESTNIKKGDLRGKESDSA